MQTGRQDRLVALVGALLKQPKTTESVPVLSGEPDADLSWSGPDGVHDRLCIYLLAGNEIVQVTHQRAAHADAPWEGPQSVTLTGARAVALAEDLVWLAAHYEA